VALAAAAAWVERYDRGEWHDPPGKLALLYDLERVRELVRGSEPQASEPDSHCYSFPLRKLAREPFPGEVLAT
jgi:hypothetical protein